MKLETLKTIESALNALIVAEETKIREARVQLEDALRDALDKPEIGMGRKIPTLPYDLGAKSGVKRNQNNKLEGINSPKIYFQIPPKPY